MELIERASKVKSANRYEGADWVQRNCMTKNVSMSPFGIIVASILGSTYLGIYHLPTSILKKVDWTNDGLIEISMRGELSSWDFNRLTALIVMCHDACVRLSIEPCNPQYVRLRFWPRDGRTGGTSERHPRLEEHVDMIRTRLGDFRS